MRRSILTVFLFISFIIYCTGQDYGRTTNVSYKYYSSPGFVNITELSGAQGFENVCNKNAWYYFGATSIFGYQVGRNFICGAGTGFYIFDYTPLIPLFVELRYTTYLKFANPFFFADGGVLFDYNDFENGSKVFFNPGIGFSRSITPKIDGTLGAGLMIQMGNGVDRASFVNVKLGLIFRKQAMRLYNPTAKK